MTKRLKKIKKYIYPDLIYNSILISKFINIITISGKKNIAKNIFYKVIDYLNLKIIGGKINKGIFIFYEALNNASPIIEIKTKKLSGIIHNIPFEISNKKRIYIAMRWIKKYSLIRKEKYMYLKLSNEIIDCYNNTGNTIKKKNSLQKIAESNRSYYNFKN